jgi:hypothetical protein
MLPELRPVLVITAFVVATSVGVGCKPKKLPTPMDPTSTEEVQASNELARAQVDDVSDEGDDDDDDDTSSQDP